MSGAGEGPPGDLRLVSVAERADLWRPLNDLCNSVWPELMLHDPVSSPRWPHLRDDWPQFQLALMAGDGTIVAGANAAPLWWDGTDEGLPAGWDDQLERSVRDLADGVAPNTLGAIQIVVDPRLRGTGLSGRMLESMRSAGRNAGFGALVACVRPTAKVRYPLMPIETYARWRRADGLPFDPWLRVHVRAGGRIVRGVPASMEIPGSLAEWREWTGLEFPVSGEYVAEGALAPVAIDVERDRGLYLDPNIWVVHEL